MRMLTDNLVWKMFALALAIGAWWTLSGQMEIATSIPAAVHYRNVPPDLELSSDHLDRLFLKLRGPASRLRTSAIVQTALILDLGNVHGPGEQTFTIAGSNLALPPGVTLLRAVPSQVRVKLERRAQKEVPVEIRFAGPPPTGYRVVAQSAVPPKLKVVGPESKLEQVLLVQTDPVDLTNKVGSAQFRVPVFLQDPQVRLAEPDSVVAVRVTLEKIPQGKL